MHWVHLDTCLYLKSQWLNGGKKAEIKHSDFPFIHAIPTSNLSLCWWIALRRFQPDLCQTPTRFRMTLLGTTQRHSLPLFVFSSHAGRRNPLCMQFSPVVWQFQNIILQKGKWCLGPGGLTFKERLWLSNFDNYEIQLFLDKESSLAILLLITTKEGKGTQKGRHIPVCLSLEDNTMKVRLRKSEFQYRKWMVTGI